MAQPLSEADVLRAKCDVLADLLNSTVAELAVTRAALAQREREPEQEAADAVPE